MKNTVFRFVIVLIAGSLLLSCAGMGATYKLDIDENRPADQKAVIAFLNNDKHGLFRLISWNGSEIKQDLYGDKSAKSYDKTVLTVPAGDNSFLFDLSYVFQSGSSFTYYNFRDIEIQYFLEPGKQYQVKGRSKGMLKVEFFISIYEVTNKSVLLEEWKIGQIGIGT